MRTRNFLREIGIRPELVWAAEVEIETGIRDCCFIIKTEILYILRTEIRLIQIWDVMETRNVEHVHF